MRDVVIVDAVRTSLGRRGGTLSQNHPIETSALLLNALKERNHLEPDVVDHVIYGCVSEVGAQSTNQPGAECRCSPPRVALHVPCDGA